MILNKKASHAGIMISFAIFVTFIIFLIIILDPAAKKPESKDKLVDFIELKLIENISSNSYINLSHLENLIVVYDDKYSHLKQKFGVPDYSDFWFGLEGEATLKPVENIPNDVAIYVEETPVAYNSSGEIKYGSLWVKVW